MKTGKNALGIGAGQGVSVCVADAGRHNAHQYFAFLKWCNIHFDNFQWLVGGKRHGRARFNHWLLLIKHLSA